MERQARAWVLGAAVGAGALYLFDARLGRSRRARLRDRMVHAAHVSRDGADTVFHDVENRAQGLWARLSAWLREDDCPDPVLYERVRARLGRCVSHPSSVEVMVTDGHVVLAGPILTAEVEGMLDEIRRVPGVRSLEEHLEIHEEAGNVPGLQGTPARASELRQEWMQSNWSPAARFAAGCAGAALAGMGVQRGGLLGTLLAGTGAGLVARAATNQEIRRLVGIGVGRRVVDIQKTMHIRAPIDRVYQIWSSFEEFPKFMTHVRDVQRLDEQRWRWVVGGPAGTVTWDAVVTGRAENDHLSWRTVPGSMIQHAGQVRFHRAGEDDTRVEIRFTYNPVIGAVGHAVAAALGMDPHRLMDHDLMRMKAFMETGQIPHDAAKRDVAEAEAKMRGADGEGEPQHPVH